jgi:hypothetical protein
MNVVSGQIVGKKKVPSIDNQPFEYIFFKCSDGRSRRMCLSPVYGNYHRWNGLTDIGTELGGLLVRNNLVDADSFPKLVKRATCPERGRT